MDHRFFRYETGQTTKTKNNTSQEYTPRHAPSKSNGFTLIVKSSTTLKTLTILNAFPTDSVKDIKERINEKTGAHVKLQELSFDGSILKYDHQTLYHLHIAHESTVYLTVRNLRITLTIKMKNKRTMTLHLLTSDTVQTVKQQIYLRENIPIQQQILHLNGKNLSNEQRLSHYNILEDVTLHLMQSPLHNHPIPVSIDKAKEKTVKQPSTSMIIFIEIEAIKTLTLTVTKNQSVLSVKEMIFETESFEIHRQYLVFNEKELENEHDLKYYHIEANSKLYLFLTVQHPKAPSNCSKKSSQQKNSKKKRKNKSRNHKRQNKFKHKPKKNKYRNNKNKQTQNVQSQHFVQKKSSKKQAKDSSISGFERLDFGLNLYYEQMGEQYKNSFGVGKFIEWAEENGFDADGIDDEFENVEECNYVNFDDEFPLHHSYADLECDDVKIYKTLRHCHVYGYPPGYSVSKYVSKLNQSLNCDASAAKSIKSEIMNNQRAIDKIQTS